MGLRIRTNVASLVAQRQLGRVTDQISDNYERLSSGFRINKAADDAAGLGISEKQRTRVRSLEQARRNANDGVSFVQVTEGSMSEISNILIRMRELAVQSASDTISNKERAYTNREYVQLVQEIDRIANVTEFNGIKALQGAGGNNGDPEMAIHLGAGDGKIPNTDTLVVNLDEIKLHVSEDLGLGMDAEVGPSENTSEFHRTTAAAKIEVLDGALNKIASHRATLGAKQSQLSTAIAALGIEIENLHSAKSRVRDVDFAAETAQLTQNKILSSSGISVLTQANQMPELALALLRS